MRNKYDKPLVSTIKEHCRICYTCVRECPAKAIRITDGQAEVMADRCIGCGNCVRVCSQNAKKVVDSKQEVYELLAGSDKIAAIIAPSFPAEFMDCDWKKLVGMVRKLGFDYVNEVGFGADLVADRFNKLLKESEPDCRYIATSCPAIVAYIEKYHPDLVENLAPIVSPMAATARVLRRLHNDNLKIVFIGPCIAKKGEVASKNMPDELDVALTFTELVEMFENENIKPDNVEPSVFDEPCAGTGAIFPITRGLFQSAQLQEDLIDGEIIAVEGGGNFVEAFKEFENGDMDVRLLEVLACNGCIMGPGISHREPLFKRRSCVSGYVREKMEDFDNDKWIEQVKAFDDLDMSRRFAAFDQRIQVSTQQELEQILRKMGKTKPEDELNCGACGYNTCREHATAILKGLAESEMCLPYTIEKLHSAIGELAVSNNQLASTQEALMQSEKLASMGQLAAGIAHEINNPLCIVLMYAHLLLDKHQTDEPLHKDLDLIAEQANRCKDIVGGLLNFARKNKVMFEPTDIYRLVKSAVKTVPNEKGVAIKIENELKDSTMEMDGNQISQVLTNLIANAISATEPDGGIVMKLSDSDGVIELKVSDTGIGIVKENMTKIFEPFFTTKQIGKGTGLGLAVAYGIIKMHNGDIKVESNADAEKGPTGTVFTITVPRKRQNRFESVEF